MENTTDTPTATKVLGEAAIGQLKVALKAALALTEGQARTLVIEGFSEIDPEVLERDRVSSAIEYLWAELFGSDS